MKGKLAVKPAVGKFPEIPAPDESWRSCKTDIPPTGELLQTCTICQTSPNSQPNYFYSRAHLRKSYGRAQSWVSVDGHVLVFDPDFWKEV